MNTIVFFLDASFVEHKTKNNVLRKIRNSEKIKSKIVSLAKNFESNKNWWKTRRIGNSMLFKKTKYLQIKKTLNLVWIWEKTNILFITIKNFTILKRKQKKLWDSRDN